jgi:predicted ester cyclase
MQMRGQDAPFPGRSPEAATESDGCSVPLSLAAGERPHRRDTEMSVEETQLTMNGYLKALLDRTDFERYFATDVVWTTMETGDVVRGREAVRDFIVALHVQLFDAHPEVEFITVADGSACLEAVFVGKQIAEFAGIAAQGAQVRLPYCVCYSLENKMITELRAYFPIAALVNQLSGPANSSTVRVS